LSTSHTAPRKRLLTAALVVAVVSLAATSLLGADGSASEPRATKLIGSARPLDLEAMEAAVVAVDAPRLVLDDVDPVTSTAVVEPEWILEVAPALGESFGRIRIPKAGVDWPLIEGVQKEQLDISPGHMPRTAMPGQFGNAVIAGHRSTFGAPFSHLDLLEPGDEIQVDTGIGTHTYAVVSTEIVPPTGMWTVQHRDGGWLTLVTCHPKGSNAQRMIVFARLVDGPNLAAVEAAFTGEYLPPRDPATEEPEESPPHDPGDVVEVSGPYPAVFETRWL
jgi:LPXTG-site transpeptidase (sortase) family protein